MTVGGWCRTLRAGVFAVACVLLAALGHVTMSGSDVPGWSMAAGAAGTGAAGWFLAGRERGRALIVTVVVAAQALLHETFSLAQTVTPGPAASGPGLRWAETADTAAMNMDSMDMGAMSHMASDMSGATTADSMAHMGAGATFGMLAAHVLAAVLCGIWLAYGERAVFSLLRAAAARLAAPLRMLLALPAPSGRPVRRRRRPERRTALARLLLCYSVTSRGPPVGAAAV
ncbi:hypothetical protein ACFXAW_10600 [Streptomyces sp. NPDC059445]|uniref:hypothetical protein n=1 Tax=Streptomyces sp. NPDC059445 TaxID=3346832 RepID=UPI0036B98D7E